MLGTLIIVGKESLIFVRLQIQKFQVKVTGIGKFCVLRF